MNKIIVVAHSKGGVGKSVVAWHLAGAYIEKDIDVTILDLDFQQTLFFVNQIRVGDDTLKQIKVKQEVEAAKIIDIFDNNRGVLIVDVGGFDIDINRIAISYADVVIVPISNSTTEVIGVRTFEDILEEIGATNIKVLLNKVHHATKDFSAIEEAIGDKPNIAILTNRVTQKKLYDSCMGFGKTIFDTKGISAKDVFRGIRDEI
ncbi:MAG: ParA family protein [Sulfurovum sp.]